VLHFTFESAVGYGVALVMEDDAAVPLSSCIPRQGFSDSEFLPIAIQIVCGLHAIHNKNIIHNDIKPSNIIISQITKEITKAIKIIDFNQATYWRQRTHTGVPGHDVTGSLAYLSPEKTGRVNRSLEPDHRSDLYSLGITYYVAQYLLRQLIRWVSFISISLYSQYHRINTNQRFRNSFLISL